MSEQQMKYTQVIDEKSGEIKYVPEAPPQAPPPPPNNGEIEEADGGEISKHGEVNDTDKIQRRLYSDFKTPFDNMVDSLDTNIDKKLHTILNNLVVNSKKLRYERRLDHGKLDGRSLVRHKVSDRLFKKKAIKYRKYRFTILVDTSGSMFNSDGPNDETKMSVAISSVIKICKTLESIGIPVSLIAMNQSVGYLKAFDETFDFDVFIERLRKNSLCTYKIPGESEEHVNLGGTSEAVAYDETVKYIRNTTKKGEENILFVLSDGAPGTDGTYTPVLMPSDSEERLVEIDDDRSQSTAKLRDFWKGVHDIKVYGIGILSQARQIPFSKSLDDVTKLPEFINNLIQDILY